ncbi:MAG: KDO2-lipid IV(A) lauroyltransferase [Flavobacteriales bacterium]|jgi:KDO2-lipid IV(A) lauroyltransferase
MCFLWAAFGSSLGIRLKFRIALIVFHILGSLPLSFARGLGACIGTIAFFLRTRACKVTCENLKRCFPGLVESEISRLAQQSMCETGKLAIEACVVLKNDKAWTKNAVLAIHNEDLVMDALAKNKGLIVLAPHLGNWEVLGKVLTDYGDLTNLYLPPKQAIIEKLVKHYREKDGSKTVPTTSRGVASLLKAIKKGGLTGILPDQCPPLNAGIFSEFYSEPALTMTLIHGLIQRTECELVVAAALRVNGGFDIHFIKPDAGIFSANLEESVLATNKCVERAIELAPEQYQWEYKRFRKQPEGYAKPYRF